MNSEMLFEECGSLLKAIWPQLDGGFKDSYWESIAQSASVDRFRGAVSQMIGDLESGRPLKRGKGILHIKRRSLSNDELKRGVLRFKDRLFDVVDRGPHLFASVFWKVMRVGYLTEINQVLDTFNVAHDEAGSKEAGAVIRQPQAEEVLRMVDALANSVGHDRLAVSLCILYCNSPDWAFLAESVKRIASIEAASAKARIEEQCAIEEEMMATDKQQSATAQDIQSGALTKRIADLKANVAELQCLVGPLSLALIAGRRPDSTKFFEMINVVSNEFDALQNLLGPSDSSIASFEAALGARDGFRAAQDLFARLKTVRHRSIVDFSGCARIVSECDTALGLLRAGSPLDELLEPFQALQTLIASTNSLSDDEEARLDGMVGAKFGHEVVGAISRGRMSFGNAMADTSGGVPTSTTQSETNESASDEPARDVAIFSGVPATGEDNLAPGSCEEVDVHRASNGEALAKSGEAISGLRLGEAVGSPQDGEIVSVNPPIPVHVGEARAGSGAAGPISEASKPPISDGTSDSRQLSANETDLNVTAPFVQDELIDFAAFCENVWIGADGQISPAPWKSPDFASKALKAGSNALAHKEFALTYLYFLAADALGLQPPIDPRDLQIAADLFDQGRTAESFVDRDWARRFLQCYQANEQRPDLRLILCLESVAPFSSNILNPADLSRMCAFAHYHDRNLSQIVLGLLQEQAEGGDPIEALRLALEDERTVDQSSLDGQLAKDRQQLKAQISALWSAAGGRIVRTHCRTAWRKFVEQEIAPLRDILVSHKDEPRDYLNWPMRDLEERERLLLVNYRKIANEGEVRNADRKKADKAAGDLVQNIGRVLESARRLLHRARTHRHSFSNLPANEAHDLLEGKLLDDPIDELCQQILRSLVTSGTSSRSPLRIFSSVFLACPDLMRFLPEPPKDLEVLAGEGVSPSALVRVCCAAAYMLQSDVAPPSIDANRFGPAMLDLLMDRQQPELLAVLAQTRLLESNIQTKLHREADNLGSQVYLASESLRHIWRDCEALIAPESAEIGRLSNEARGMSNERVHLQSIAETRLALAWLNLLVKRSGEIRENTLKQYETLIQTRYPEVLQDFEMARSTGELRDIPRLARKTEIAASSVERGGVRRTLWRRAAEEQFSRTGQILNGALDGLDEIGKELVKSWLTRSALSPNDQYRRLRQLFYSFISGDSANSEKGRKKHDDPKELRALENQRVTIDAQQVRKMFRRERANPTFLPQLKDFSKIIIVSAPHLSTATTTAVWVRSVNAQNDANALVVLLAPGITAVQRAEVLGEFRSRKLGAAIIDDVDFCRLVAMDNPTGHDFVPFLEVVLEQLALDLHSLSPFSPVDGQNTPMEMFVGRQEQADALAYKPEYTRVFSGRKLGKSAMLKHVEINYDGLPLPSNLKLNVFFISIPGIDNEITVVARVLEEFSKRFGTQRESDGPDQTPANRFVDYVRAILAARPRESLLIILDEADTFIEGQLLHQRDKPESTLSFRMMKELPAIVDERGFPRARVVLSGYRKTNTHDGVWANAGAILSLKPLREEEATQFIEGAFTRIGININSLAGYVASRCGFQPAVLIRFGSTLLARLKKTRTAAERDSIQVTEEDVIETFNDQAVQNEIRTVVNNNFQSNPAGQAIFSATLLAMKDLAPGYMLEEGAQQVLRKLYEIEGNLDWLERIDSMPKAEIERNLQDFIDRELLVSDETRFSDRTYRLRFPHFLPVLTQHTELQQQVKQAIGSLRNTSVTRGVGGSVIAQSAMETVRHWFAQDTTEFCRLCVIAGLWVDAIQSERVGVANRLGIAPDVIVDCRDKIAYAAGVKDGRRIFTEPTRDQCLELLETAWIKPAIVTGGIDVLRRFIELGEAQTDVPIEIIGTHRLAPQMIAWWFESVRALHFQSGNAAERLIDATKCSPLLAAELDKLLRHEAGNDVTESELQSILAAFETRSAALSTELGKVGSHAILSSREQELLLMVGALASEGLGVFKLEADFADLCALCGDTFPRLKTMPLPFTKSEDHLALRLLDLSGLISLREIFPGQRMVDEPTGGFAAQVFLASGR